MLDTVLYNLLLSDTGMHSARFNTPSPLIQYAWPGMKTNKAN